MIQVKGQDPAVLTRRMQHHAEALRPMINELLYGLVLGSRFAQDEEVHTISQSRTGPGSFAFLTAGGSEYHFRPHPKDVAIVVKDAYVNGTELATLRSPAQAKRFVKTIAKSP